MITISDLWGKRTVLDGGSAAETLVMHGYTGHVRHQWRTRQQLRLQASFTQAQQTSQIATIWRKST